MRIFVIDAYKHIHHLPDCRWEISVTPSEESESWCSLELIAEGTPEEDLIIDLAINVPVDEVESTMREIALLLMKASEHTNELDRAIWICCDHAYLEELLQKVKGHHKVINFRME